MLHVVRFSAGRNKSEKQIGHFFHKLHLENVFVNFWEVIYNTCWTKIQHKAFVVCFRIYRSGWENNQYYMDVILSWLQAVFILLKFIAPINTWNYSNPKNFNARWITFELRFSLLDLFFWLLTVLGLLFCVLVLFATGLRKSQKQLTILLVCRAQRGFFRGM